MKKLIVLYTAIAICFVLIIGCSKNDSATNPPPTSNEPLVTPEGTPTGTAVTASIDANGGTLSSADGKLQLTVPAGAVSKTTIFSIQPYTNQCPGGFGTAYRLLPESVTFTLPVTLIFSYNDALVANDKFLGIAYQGTDKTWFAPKIFSLNSTDNNISVQTKHFCTMGLFETIILYPSNAVVKINESINLEVIFVGEARTTTDADGMELANLNFNRTYASTWQVNGTNGNDASGHVVKQSETKATYTAPSVVPDDSHNPVAVSATLNNVSFIFNRVAYSNPRVLANIKVIDKGVQFNVEFTSSRPLQPVGNKCFTETDSAHMSIILKDDGSVVVFNLYNEDAKVLPKSLSDGGCQYTVTKPGDGFFNISPGITISGSYDPTNHLIFLGTDGISWGFTPTFKINCTGSAEKIEEGYKQVTLPTSLTFDINKDYQEILETIPGGGFFPDGFIKTAITKVK